MASHGAGQQNMHDDEALARMLQFEEQSKSAQRSGTAGGASSVGMSQQEIRDLELAQELFRMDMEGGRGRDEQGASSNNNSALNNRNQYQLKNSPPDHRVEERATATATAQHQQLSHSQHRTRPRSVDEHLEFARRQQEQAFQNLDRRRSRSHDGSTRSEEDHLDYARKQQVEAFQDLDRRRSRSRCRSHDDASESSDFEMAMRMQEMEERGQQRRRREARRSRSRGRSHDDSESSDFEIARRMQELEDRGQGNRINKDDNDGSVSANEQFESAAAWNPSSRQEITLSARDLPDALTRSLHEHSARLSPDQDEDRKLPAEFPLSAGARTGTRVALSKGTSRRLKARLAHSAPSSPYARRLPVLNPLADDGGTSVEPAPAKEKKKTKLRVFLGNIAGQKKPAAASSSSSVASAGQSTSVSPRSAAARLSAIPPPPGGSISIKPPTTPSGRASSRRTITASPRTPRNNDNKRSISSIPISPAPTLTPVRQPKQPPPSPSLHPGVGSLGPGPVPHSVAVRRSIYHNMNQTGLNTSTISLNASMNVCAVCHRSGGHFLAALDRKYHVECFRCATCHERIDASIPFSYSRDEHGYKQPHHRQCFAEKKHGVKCAVCGMVIPALGDGTVCFVKHPFFETEQMCPRHAELPGRRCTGCHRFEPNNAPFADLHDDNRCVCYACCRTVVVDNSDVLPLWTHVLSFFESTLQLPVWKPMRDIPILVVESAALNDHLDRGDSVHRGSSQIMARGLCLTDHDNHDSFFKLPTLKYDVSSSSFGAVDTEERGFTYFEVQKDRCCSGNPDATVFAILCLSGLPRDLTTSILAHEATHAWIKLHPNYDSRRPLPPQVEEGCAQLISMLMLKKGLGPPERARNDDDGPSDEKLRQYFRFSIEHEEDEIYGVGYRKAAAAYRNIGIEALLSHVIRYRDFPTT